MTMPTPNDPLKIGTRGSVLALAQAHETRARLMAVHDLPAEAFEIVLVEPEVVPELVEEGDVDLLVDEVFLLIVGPAAGHLNDAPAIDVYLFGKGVRVLHGTLGHHEARVEPHEGLVLWQAHLAEDLRVREVLDDQRDLVEALEDLIGQRLEDLLKQLVDVLDDATRKRGLVITFVREPVSRFYSSYAQKLTRQDHVKFTASSKKAPWA